MQDGRLHSDALHPLFGLLVHHVVLVLPMRVLLGWRLLDRGLQSRFADVVADATDGHLLLGQQVAAPLVVVPLLAVFSLARAFGMFG